MALYKFIKTLGNKKAGGIYPLLPSAGAILINKGYVEAANTAAVSTPKAEERPVKEAKAKDEQKKRGRKPKNKK